MQDNCILCGQEVQRGGFSAKVEGVVLRPLCPSCDARCSKEPRKIFDEHRDIFERIRRGAPLPSPNALVGANSTVSDRPHSFPGNVAAPQGKSAALARSQRERSLGDRYIDAYRVANTAVAFGNTVKTVGVVLAALIFIPALLFTLASANQTSGNGMALALGALLLGAVFAGAVGIVFFVLGTLLCAHGQLLRATLDTAVNTSPFLTDDLRSEIMSL